MSLRQNAFVLAVLTVFVAIMGAWSGDATLAGLWRLPLGLLLLGLAYEGWMTTRAHLSLTIDAGQLGAYLGAQEASLGGRYMDRNEAVQAIQTAIENNQTNATVRIYHNDAQHTVQSGETLMTIAWDYGVPYPWIQQSNPGMGDNLSVGQTLTIPSPDNFLEFPVVENKRIEVSMPEQRVRVYENGQLKWDWAASTGISSSLSTRNSFGKANVQGTPVLSGARDAQVWQLVRIVEVLVVRLAVLDRLFGGESLRGVILDASGSAIDCFRRHLGPAARIDAV